MLSTEPKWYDQLIVSLTYQLKPKLSLFWRGIQFYSSKQKTESVNDRYLKVRSSASGCDFQNLLDDRKQDKFMGGMGLVSH